MKIEDAPIGTRLELEIISKEGIKIGLIHISQLIEIPNNENIIISCPIYESNYVFFAIGTTIKLTFFSENLNCLLFFTGKILNKDFDDNIQRLHININSELQKLQRRNYYRFECDLPAKYRIMNELNIEEVIYDSPPEIKDAVVKNISGSGARIVIDDEISTGVTLDVDIFLNGKIPLKAKCKAVRVIEIPFGKYKKYEIGLFFLELTKKGQDDVVKYIFERQRESIKRPAYNKKSL